MAIKISGTTIIDDSRVLINTGNVGVGTTNPNSVVSGSNTSIVHAGIVTARELYGDGSNLTDIGFATTAGIATYTSEWILETGNGSDYGISGPGLTGTENDPTFYLSRGEQYKFTNNTGGHPFRIQSTPNGSVGTQYNDGITNNDAGNGTTLLWNVQFDSPDILYYQCTTGGHGGMGGKIYIVNAGIASDVNLFTTGISTLGGVEISAGIVTATSGIVTYYGDGSKLSNLPSTGEDDDWIRTSAGIHTVASNVGIGTTNPTENLEVRGNIRIEEGDLLVGTGRTFVVATSTGTTSYISARSGIITTSEQTILVPPVNNANNFNNGELPGNDIDIIGSFTSGDTTFTTTNGDSNGINDVLTDPDYTGPSINSGRYFLVPTNNQSAQLFGGSNRILSFDFGTNTFTVASPALISDNDVGTQEYEFEMVYGDPISPAGEYNFVGIGTDNPLYPLHVAPPLQITNSSYPALFVDGNAYVKGSFLKIGDFSITLDASVDGAEKLHFSRGNNIGIHSQSSNSISVSGSLTADSIIETVGISTNNIISLNVTVGVKTTGDVYLGTGSTEKFLIEGNRTPYLHLTAGRTYRFNQEDASNVNHTLKFYTDLAQTSEVSGVTTVGTAGSEGAYTQLAVHSVNTPSRIFYGSIGASHVGNMAMVEATSNNSNSGIVSFSSISVASSVTAGQFYGDGSNLTNLTGASAATYGNATNVAQVVVDANGRITGISNVAISGGTGTTGVTIENDGSPVGTAITTINFSSNVTATASGTIATITSSGGGGGGSGTFDTGITTSIYVSVNGGIGTAQAGLTTVAANNDIFIGPDASFTFPATAGKSYVIESIHVTNIYNTNLYFTSRHDFNGGQNVPTTQRVVVPYQGSLELLEEPIIAKPSDVLSFQALVGVGTTATGVNNGLDSFIIYSEKTDTDYIGTGVTVTTPAGTEMFTSNTNPSVIQSIRLCNYDLSIDVDASVSIYRGGSVGGILTTGVRQGYLVYNMTVPKNSVIEILERPKYLAANDTIVVGIAGTTLTDSLSATLSGKYIT